MSIIAGKQHGKRDSDGYVCRHGICGACRATVYKLWVGNLAGQRYAEPMIQNAINAHICASES